MEDKVGCRINFVESISFSKGDEGCWWCWPVIVWPCGVENCCMDLISDSLCKG